MNNPQQPREYDAVLGGNSPSLEGAAVLGGIEGVKLRLQNPDLKVRIAALEQALNYGEQGLDLVIEGLHDEILKVQNAAYLLLKNRIEEKVREALIIFELKSAVGIDYTKLRDLLAAGKWKEADEETSELMFAAANLTNRRWWMIRDIDNFPREDFCTIDRLWVKYSDGWFGFSIQKQIYQSLGGTINYNPKFDWQAFEEALGWYKHERNFSIYNNINKLITVTKKPLSYEEITFDKRAKKGHLPCFWSLHSFDWRLKPNFDKNYGLLCLGSFLDRRQFCVHLLRHGDL
jgi:hypothetical protein